MKKVVYSITRYRKDTTEKITGLGYVTDTDLVIACVSQAGRLVRFFFITGIIIPNFLPFRPGLVYPCGGYQALGASQR